MDQYQCTSSCLLPFLENQCCYFDDHLLTHWKCQYLSSLLPPIVNSAYMHMTRCPEAKFVSPFFTIPSKKKKKKNVFEIINESAGCLITNHFWLRLLLGQHVLAYVSLAARCKKQHIDFIAFVVVIIIYLFIHLCFCCLGISGQLSARYIYMQRWENLLS